MIYLTAVITAVAAYLIGSVNTSIILSRVLSGEDIRSSGSGNAGATNMLRTHGKKMGVITLIADILKGVLAVVLTRYIVYTVIPNDVFSNMSLTETNIYLSIDYIAGLFVILGHDFPIFFGFRGGKGVATSLGVVMILDWKIGLAVAVCAIAIMAITRYVSLGSVIGGAAYVVAEIIKMCVQGEFIALQLICTVIIGGLLIAKHHANIGRLLNGTESKLGRTKA